MVLAVVAGPRGSTFKMVPHLHIVPQCFTHGVLYFELLHMAWVSPIMVVSGYLITFLTRGRSYSYQVSKGLCPELAVSLLLHFTGPNHIQEVEK